MIRPTQLPDAVRLSAAPTGAPELFPGCNAGRGEARTHALVRVFLDASPTGDLVMSREELHEATAHIDATSLPVAEAVELAAAHLRAMGMLGDLTSRQMCREWARFAFHLRHQAITVVGDIQRHHCEAWCLSATNRNGGWQDPSVSTRRARHSSAKALFQCLWALHITQIDPTRGIALPPRSSQSTRPLTDDEELLCRLASAHTLTEVRRPAAWALGQATATTTEQSAIRQRDIRLDEERVWIHGSKRTPRWGQLTPWGVEAIGRALANLPDDPDTGVVYYAQNDRGSGAASVCQAVSNTLDAAHLKSDPDIRPGSLPNWAGRQIFEATGRIDLVAKQMGLVSLDTAARSIRWDWL